jgi:hypothetical protein
LFWFIFNNQYFKYKFKFYFLTKQIKINKIN